MINKNEEDIKKMTSENKDEEEEDEKERLRNYAKSIPYPLPLAPNINQRRYNSKYGGGVFGRK